MVSFAINERQYLKLKARSESEGCSLSDLIRRQLALQPNVSPRVDRKKRQLGLALGSLYDDIRAGAIPENVADRLLEIVEMVQKL
jgi:hypothetical protein